MSVDIEQILARVRAEAEKLELAPYPAPTPLTNPPLPPQTPEEKTTTLSVQVLVSLPRQHFLQESYRLLFGRPIDPEGQSHYQGLLSQGHSRTEILYALVHSPEGQGLGLKLSGLGWRAALCRWGLKYHKYIPPRIQSALYAGRGGWAGKLARLLPGPILRILLAPFWLNHLPNTWLKRWENTIRQPLAPLAEYIFALHQDTEYALHKLAKVQQDTEATVHGIEEKQTHLTQDLANLQERQTRFGQNLDNLQQALLAQDQRQREQEQTLAWLRYSLSHHWHRALRDTPPAPSPASPGAEQEALDAFYIAFEDAFRGSETDIRQGMTVYLERIQGSAAAHGHPIIDLGCGRGEWLRLLREHGLNARGIDQSPAMVERARAHGLEVEQNDAVLALSRLPDASVGAVTGFHIIEHLPFPVLFRLFAEAARVLVPNGVIIFETPNPENILVGSHTFYHDPTHRNPITPAFITFLAQYHGFADIEIMRLHPYPESAKVPGHDPLTERVNGHLCGPQDFALIAYRPRPA